MGRIKTNINEFFLNRIKLSNDLHLLVNEFTIVGNTLNREKRNPKRPDNQIKEMKLKRVILYTRIIQIAPSLKGKRIRGNIDKGSVLDERY